MSQHRRKQQLKTMEKSLQTQRPKVDSVTAFIEQQQQKTGKKIEEMTEEELNQIMTEEISIQEQMTEETQTQEQIQTLIPQEQATIPSPPPPLQLQNTDPSSVESSDRQVTTPYSNEALITKVIHSEERFGRLEHNVNNLNLAIQQMTKAIEQVATHVNSVQNKFNEALSVVEQMVPVVTGGLKTPPKDSTITAGSPTGVPGSPQASLAGGNGAVVNIMDRLIQAYTLSKQFSHGPDNSMQTFMSSMQMGVEMLKTMNTVISSLKSDWIKEQRSALDILKADNITRKKDKG